jgi:hypothetical protein
MALGAQVDVQISGRRGARLEGVAATAGYGDFFIFRLNFEIHGKHSVFSERDGL